MEHILLAKEIAMKGKYVELKTILESEQTLYMSDAAPLFVEEESSDSVNIVSHYIPEPIQLPNSWNPNSFQSPKNQSVELTNFSNLPPVPASVPSGEGTINSVSENARDEEQEVNTNEEPRRSHDFSQETIHIRSSKNEFN